MFRPPMCASAARLYQRNRLKDDAVIEVTEPIQDTK
jgi:hypothetical protein